jgi:hypothetical protein
MGFWERTWKERADAIQTAFGETEPMGTVVSFSWNDRIRLPGACALQLPPCDERRDPVRHRRSDWLYLTMGLSQPLDKRQVTEERAAGKSYSARGFELAFLTKSKESWPTQALYWFLTHITDGEEIAWGDRFPMGFGRRTDGSLAPYVGNTEGHDLVNQIRAVLFWPYLFPDGRFITSTGKFLVLVATGITGTEWQLAKETTTAHLLLLLCRAGVGQRTIPERTCLLSEAQWKAEWDRIAARPPEECVAEFEHGIGYPKK